MKKILLYIISLIGVSFFSAQVAYRLAQQNKAVKLVLPAPEYEEKEIIFDSYLLGDFTCRLEDGHYVKLVGLALAYKGKKYKYLAAELVDRIEQIKDIINSELMRSSAEQLSKLAGKEELRTRLTNNINKVLQAGKLETVYFQLLVQ